MQNGGQTGARLALLSVSAVWGLTFVVVADAVSVTNPYMFNAARFALGAALVGLVVAMRGGLRTAGLVRHLRYGVVLGTLLFGGFITQTIGLQSTTPGKAGFITGLSVVLVPFFSHFLLGIRVRRIEAVAAAVSVLGLFLLSLSGGMSGLVIGDAYVLVCALFFGLHIVVTDRFVKHAEVRVGLLTLVQLTVVSLLSLAFAVGLYGDLSAQLSLLADPRVYVGVVVCGVLATAYAYLVQTGMQRRVSPTQVALIFILEPVFAGVFDYLFDGRVMGPAQLLGAGLIVFAMGMTEIRLRRPSPVQAV
jgi:drug/metabolite transporter (DMT)-like permease